MPPYDTMAAALLMAGACVLVVWAKENEQRAIVREKDALLHEKDVRLREKDVRLCQNDCVMADMNARHRTAGCVSHTARCRSAWTWPASPPCLSTASC